MINFIINYWLQILFGLIISLFTYILKQFIEYKKTLDLTSKGVIVMLRIKIIEMYEKLSIKDEISIEEKESIFEIYKVYSKLECCTIVDDLIKKIDSIEVRR